VLSAVMFALGAGSCARCEGVHAAAACYDAGAVATLLSSRAQRVARAGRRCSVTSPSRAARTVAVR
jgi:hypothetical protein